MSDTVEGITPVDANYTVTVPPCVRDEVDLEGGDRLRWRVGDDGELNVEVLKQSRGSFAELEPIELDEGTNAASDPFR